MPKLTKDKSTYNVSIDMRVMPLFDIIARRNGRSRSSHVEFLMREAIKQDKGLSRALLLKQEYNPEEHDPEPPKVMLVEKVNASQEDTTTYQP